jgi:hypothetical protein
MAPNGRIMSLGPFLLIGLLLLVLWAGGFLMLHVASFLIHLLLLMAVIFFVAHLAEDTKPV